ncbi:MAG: Na+/H+ antiporter NhaC family protein [Planctomycetes bacterium]|nr:Na+/H+ antiporter NhaC family protein [Planctomycetota bacterium]
MATIHASVGVCLVACWLAPADGPPCHGIVPPLLAVTLALVTNRLRLCLAAAVLCGGVLAAVGGAGGAWSTLFEGLWTGGTFFLQTVYNTNSGTCDADHLLILLYVVLIMVMISVMLAGGGLQGVADWLTRFARSARSTRLATVAMGLAIFIDDYANTMIVGSTLRPITDRQRISREKLAFLVDATAAPIAGIALISTWVGYEVTQLADVGADLGIGKGGYAMLVDALGYRFYCLGMIAFVFLNAATGLDFGPMAVAERKAAAGGKPGSPLPAPGDFDTTGNTRSHASVAILPMVALLGVFGGALWIDGGGLDMMGADSLAPLRWSAWAEVLGQANSIRLLAYASAFGLAVALVMAWAMARISAGKMLRAVASGVRISFLPVTVLVLAWSLQGTCDALGTGKFLVALLGDAIPPAVFPALVFCVAGLTAFATGTSWGTMAILIPTALPVAFGLDGAVYGPVTVLSVAAILDGAIFGDHCSPISDTTIMSSAASSCDHLAHVRTQMPYSLVVAAAALGVGYLPAALGAPQWLTLASLAAFMAVLFLALGAVRRRAG